MLGKIGLYMRLSRDDERAGESASIENQRKILRGYVRENGGVIVQEYVDDGWSGTDFSRPAVSRLLDDAKTGKIDTIIVKDLSRFGRNYIQVGQYVDYIFPAYGIRFIALSDNVDTAAQNNGSMDMMPIMNVFNEWHAANTSRKIRAVLDANRRAGRFTNWSYPYGYKAGNDEKRTAQIDESAADVVRRIYSMRLRGFTLKQIARTLTDEGTENPATHFEKLGGGKSARKCSPFWSAKTVRDILTNPVYVGTTVQHKTSRVSYKNHKVVALPPSEWVIKRGAHSPIIDIKEWKEVQRINGSVRSKSDKNSNVHLFSGLLVCPDCGKKMRVQTSRSGGCRYVCRTYKDVGKKYCSSHGIGEEALVEVMQKEISTFPRSKEILSEREKKLAALEKASTTVVGQSGYLRKRLAELEKLMRSAFEARILNDLHEDEYESLMTAYREEKSRLERILSNAKDKSQTKKPAAPPLSDKCAGQDVGLNRELLLLFVERIEVGERQSDGARELHIFYKFPPQPDVFEQSP